MSAAGSVYQCIYAALFGNCDSQLTCCEAELSTVFYNTEIACTLSMEDSRWQTCKKKKMELSGFSEVPSVCLSSLCSVSHDM